MSISILPQSKGLSYRRATTVNFKVRIDWLAEIFKMHDNYQRVNLNLKAYLYLKESAITFKSMDKRSVECPKVFHNIFFRFFYSKSIQVQQLFISLLIKKLISWSSQNYWTKRCFWKRKEIFWFLQISQKIASHFTGNNAYFRVKETRRQCRKNQFYVVILVMHAK